MCFPQRRVSLTADDEHLPPLPLQEPLVTNLATLYELSGSGAAKRRMADWVASVAPDDFDLAATKG